MRKQKGEGRREETKESNEKQRIVGERKGKERMRERGEEKR